MPSMLVISVADCNGRDVEVEGHCWVRVAGVLDKMQSNGV